MNSYKSTNYSATVCAVTTILIHLFLCLCRATKRGSQKRSHRQERWALECASCLPLQKMPPWQLQLSLHQNLRRAERTREQQSRLPPPSPGPGVIKRSLKGQAGPGAEDGTMAGRVKPSSSNPLRQFRELKD